MMTKKLSPIVNEHIVKSTRGAHILKIIIKSTHNVFACFANNLALFYDG